MNALRSWVVLGVVASVSAAVGIGSSNAANPAKTHTVHGTVVSVDHKHHKFTVRTKNQNGGKNGQHHEHVFHVNQQTHFDFMGGQNKQKAHFNALRHGEHVVVHTSGGQSNLAHRVDIAHQQGQQGVGQQNNGKGKQQGTGQQAANKQKTRNTAGKQQVALK